MLGRLLALVAVIVTAITGPVPAHAAQVPPARTVATAWSGASGLEEANTSATATDVANGAADPTGVTATAGATSRYVPVTPTRVLDTRTSLGGHRGKAAAGERVLLPIVGSAAPVPAEATAVVFNLTVTEPEAAGFVSAYPDGGTLPDTSSVNIERPGQTIANLVTVGLGSGGVRLYALPRTHLIVDVAGYYVPAVTATSGRLQVITPTRLLDTRADNPVRFGALPIGGTVDLDVAGLGAIPRSATAAVLNLTVTQTDAAGYVSATPQGAPLGAVSNVNVSGRGETIANQAIVPMQDGWVTLYAAMGTHVVVDLSGWFTGTASGSSGDGLFVPLPPARLLDSREPTLSPQPGIKPGVGAVFDVTTAGRRGIPTSGVSAVAVNATVTAASAPGFFTLFGAGLGRPGVSNLNTIRTGQTVPNHAIVAVSTLGLSFYSATGAHLIVDVNGYFTGTAATPQVGYVPNAGGPPSNGPHAFLYKMNDGSFARWNPCSTLTYQVNYSGAPPFARTEVARAVAKVEAATGINLVDLGDTTLGNDRIPPTGAKAVIAFVSPAESPAIDGVAGLGGGAYYTPWNGWDAYVAQGFVHINETLNYTQGTGPSGLEGLLLHELGHMVGLDHVASTDEAMYPVMHNLPWAGYGPGDRQGLWNLGAAKGCLTVGAAGYATQDLRTPTGPRPDAVSVARDQLNGAAGPTGDTSANAIVTFCRLGATTDLDQPSGAGQLLRAEAGSAPTPAMLRSGR